MVRRLMSDAQWTKIEHLLPGRAGDAGRTALDNREFVEAVLWPARTGAPWRDLPTGFDPWARTYMRFSRWGRSGVWERVALALAGEADLQQLFIDLTIVRARQHSAGAPKKTVRKRSGARGAG
jgi:transposase